MRDQSWGDFEAEFFAAGDALGRSTPNPEGEPADEFQDLEAQDAPGRWQVRIVAALLAVRHWLLWRGRLFQFFVAVTLFGGAEQALRAAKVAYAFHPRLVQRRPWLLRATFVVLVSAAVNYSAAAVLAASGAL